MTDRPRVRSSFLRSDRLVSRRILRPLREFMTLEQSGGIALLAAALLALLWANSPWSASYDSFWHTEISFRLGDYELVEDLRHFVNDGLMAIFFFVVGLEIKREIVTGELNSVRKAMFPAVGALGGMLVPALIYAAFNAGHSGSSGWGIPMATDIAFALGVLALVGRNCPTSLKIFLLSLAIVDDIGAISVIAIFYSDSIALGPLAIAGGMFALVIILRLIDVRWTPIYVAFGAVAWLATFESGIHATIAGVILGFLAPARPFAPGTTIDPLVADDLDAEGARAVKFRALAGVAVTDRLEHVLHPWTSYAIVPVFALANAGVSLSGGVADVFSSRVGLGILVGLVVGKLVGITAFCWLSAKLRIAELPGDATWTDLMGVAALAGIGFTVSLFITDLAFNDSALIADSKIAIMAASVLATIVGVALLNLNEMMKRNRASGSSTSTN
jgi:NhaA family Na+:H+ antiporter